MKIAIAGASGFVGQALVAELAGRHEIIALGRSGASPSSDSRVDWRKCDLFSAEQTQAALKGAEAAVYLVHSMVPAARLNQASFEDLDFALADSFARSARAAGVKRIVYLGGLSSGTTPLSRHLKSRIEVERALAGHGVPVTTLRSGLILGAQGSSFQMLYLLVRRLPVMLCPRWASTRLHCIGLGDAVRFLEFSLVSPEAVGKTFEIGCRESVSYRELMEKTAGLLGLSRGFLQVPLFTPGLSRLWVQLITGASAALVRPLVQSLRHEMVVRDRSIETLSQISPRGLDESLAACLKGIRPSLRSITCLLYTSDAADE